MYYLLLCFVALLAYILISLSQLAGSLTVHQIVPLCPFTIACIIPGVIGILAWIPEEASHGH